MRRVVADLPLGAWTHLAHHLPNPKRHYEIPKNKSAPSPVLIIGFGLMLADMAAAQTFTTLHSFTGRDGDGPQAGLILSGSTLYGVADSGGGSFDGTVFKINTNGTGFTTLHTFTALHNDTNSDGAYPDGNLTLSGNTLYGTSFYGGSSGNGTVFKPNTDGTGFTNLHSFAASFTNSEVTVVAPFES